MVCLTPGLTTMRFGVTQILCFLGRVFGNQRFLDEWHFFLWTTAYDWILTLDNLMLRSRPLTTWCCMCCCDGESIDHLLLHCPVTHSLWTFMLQAFGILKKVHFHAFSFIKTTYESIKNQVALFDIQTKRDSSQTAKVPHQTLLQLWK